MRRVRATRLEAVEITLVNEEAELLAHTLGLWLSGARRGEYGAGSSIEEQIAFAEHLQDALRKRLDA